MHRSGALTASRLLGARLFSKRRELTAVKLARIIADLLNQAPIGKEFVFHPKDGGAVVQGQLLGRKHVDFSIIVAAHL